MSTYVLPPLETTLNPPLSPRALSNLSSALLLTTYSSLVLLLWTWGASLRLEKRYVWGAWKGASRKGGGGRRTASGWERWMVPGRSWKIGCFALCRYLTLAQTIWVVAQLTAGRYSLGACSAARALPFGFTLTSFATHLVLAYRMYSVFAQSLAVFYSLVVMSVVDLGLQLAADVLIQPFFLTYSLATNANGGSATTAHVCYIVPTTRVFAIAFLSPTVVHHTVLLLTLFASWRHWMTEKALAASGIKPPSLMKCLRREHTGYVLATCLINFANVVLVLQTMIVPYQLIHYLPALVLTHLLLSSLWFTLEQRMDRARSASSRASSMRYSLPAIVTTPSGSPPPGTVDRRHRLSHGLSLNLGRGDRASQRLSNASVELLMQPVDGKGEAKGEKDVPPTLQAKRLSKRGGDLASSAPTLEIQKPPIPPRSSQRLSMVHSVVLIHPVSTAGGGEGGGEQDLDLPTATTFTTASPGGGGGSGGGGLSSTSPTTPGSAVPLFHLPTREIVRQASSSKGGSSPTSPVSPTSPPSSATARPPGVLPVVHEDDSPPAATVQPAEAAPTLPFPTYFTPPTSASRPALLAAPSASHFTSSSSPSPSPSRSGLNHGGYAGDRSASPSPDPSRALSPSGCRDTGRSPLSGASSSSVSDGSSANASGSDGGEDRPASSLSASSYAHPPQLAPPPPAPPLETAMLPPPFAFYHHAPHRSRLHSTQSTDAMSVASASQVEGYLPLSRSASWRREEREEEDGEAAGEEGGAEEPGDRSIQHTPDELIAAQPLPSLLPLPALKVHVRRPTGEEGDAGGEGAQVEAREEKPEKVSPAQTNTSGTRTTTTSGENTAYESAVDPAMQQKGKGRRRHGR
ncbi:hypothetical protein JCM6882_004502 [Rhodosporidiobolus microsporus]